MERLSQPGKGATCALGDNLSPENVLVGSLAPFGLGVDQYRSSPISIHFQSPSACLKGATKGLTHPMFHPSYAPAVCRP